jgi:hypothetical protein
MTQELVTNEALFANAPSWLTRTQVQQAVQKIQKTMEWDIRQVKVTWYYDQKAFQDFHGFDESVLAVTNKPENKIYLGPRVNTEHFGPVFGHELVHIVLFQKFHDAVPKWLEEGLANYVAHQGTVDYVWLASQPSIDVHALIHPFQKVPAIGSDGARYHYSTSTALIEMIASQCSLVDLLQLSVGEKLENYLNTFCGVHDINADLKEWIQRKNKPRK